MAADRTPVILAAKRTPIGRFLGSFSRTPATTLGAIAVDAVLKEAPAVRDHVEEVIMGNVLQAGLGQNPARQAALNAGLPTTMPCYTVNKVCGSGLKSVMLAAQAIRAGDFETIIAGGLENMTMAPHLANVRQGVKYGDGALVDHMAHDGLTCAFEAWAMGHAAEHIAKTHEISRDEQDRFAARSHNRAEEATTKGYFASELISIDAATIKQKQDITQDEGIRPGSSAEVLATLRPAFDKEGSVTAGNASQISDGAAAIAVTSAAKAEQMGVQPLARITGYYTSGVDPKEIFTAPVLAIGELLRKTGVHRDEVDLYEINEAFAAQVLQNAKALEIPEEKLNVCGGGVALGHPIGASGARVLVTLLHQMVRLDKKRGVAALCLGGGNSVAMMVERG
jgi:acetyl-CoA C-acetyltransferase